MWRRNSPPRQRLWAANRIAVEHQRTDQASDCTEYHRRETSRCGEPTDDRTLRDRGVVERHRAEGPGRRRAGDISFRQQGWAVAGTARARRRDRDGQSRISAGAADRPDRETEAAYRRHHPRLSPVPVYEPTDSLSLARKQPGGRGRGLEILRRA